MPARFETDTSQFPLVAVTIPSQRVTDAEILRFIDALAPDAAPTPKR